MEWPIAPNTRTAAAAAKCASAPRSKSARPALLAITEIPFGTVVPNLIASIVAAHQKEKIKIKKVDDNTSEKAEVLIHLLPGSDPEVVKNALYAFTECEILIHPNAVVILDQKPSFTCVTDILRISTERTRDLLRRELEIRLGKNSMRGGTCSRWKRSSSKRRSTSKIENCETWESVLETIDQGPGAVHQKAQRAGDPRGLRAAHGDQNQADLAV